VFHLAHAAGGLGGIVVLRFLLQALLLVALWVGKEGDDFIFLGLLAGSVRIFWAFPVERPQYVSFVLFAFLLAALGGIRSARSRKGLLLRGGAIPLLMVLWANCHGGYIVGVGVLAVWLLAESLKRTHPVFQPLPAARYRLLLASGMAGFLLSFLNPNTYHVFEVALLPAWHTSIVQEYRSSVEFYRLYASEWIVAYWALLALTTAVLVLSWRRPDLTRIALVAVTGYFSFTRVRFIPFFVVAAILANCRQFSAPRFAGKARPAFAVAGLVIGLWLLSDAAVMYRNGAECMEVNGSQLPVAAAEFIQSAGLQGNMFNLYSWGGYLLWRLWPAEVLIDGRNSDRGLFEAYRQIMRGKGGNVFGRPFWKQFFAARNIRYTVTSFSDAVTGQIHGLVDNLLADPAWVPVFTSPNSVIFVEDVPEHRRTILRHAIPKEEFYPRLLEHCSQLIDLDPSSIQPLVARGDILMRLGDNAGALRSFEAALRISPRHPVAQARVARLRELRAAEP
jgi:tetratricopeptide (TPR) repeat protein